MRVSRVSGVAVLALIAGLLGPVAPAYADPPAPSTATITAPMDGDTVSGPVTVSADGTVDLTSGDAPASMQLLVDGLADAAVPDQPCPAVPDGTCPVAFSWDATGLTGVHMLQAIMVTQMSALVSSLPLAVTVSSPGPFAVVNSPTSGTVTGPTTVSGTGTVDPSQTDSGVSLQLLVDGVPTGPAVGCPGPDPRVCTVPNLSWNSSGITGSHHLRVRFRTTNGLSKDSPQVMVTAVNPAPSASIISPASGVHFKGTLTVAALGSADPNQTDDALSLQLYVDGTSANNAIGSPTACDDPHVCALPLTWNATGQSGPHTVRVRLHTADNANPFSSSITVVVDPAPPTVSITAPGDQATVAGIVPVTVTGTIDASQTDSAAQLELFVNGTSLDKVNCAGGHSCTLNYSWDASGIVGARQLKATFTTANVTTAVSDTTNVNVVSAPPSAAVTSPANGATVSGPITVGTEGGVSPTQNDAPTSMQLLLDGVATSAAVSACTVTTALPHGCTVAYPWDTTGLTGSHTLQARFVTRKGVVVLSPVTTINVVSPLPTAVILSPATSSTVHRTAVITVSGAVDATQTDSPSSIRLTLDGSALGGAIPCAPAATTPRVCNASYSWNTFGLTGRHTLVATVVSAKGVVGTSSATSVYVYAGTATVIAPLKATRAGHSVTYTGRVTTLVNKLGVPGVKVLILLRPSVGKSRKLYVLTNVHGFFKVAFKPSVNTTIEATVVTLPFYGTSHTFSKLHVVPTFKCSVGTAVRRNGLDSGSCTVANLPKTTKVSLQYEFNGHWYTLGSGRAKGSRLSFSFRFANRGTYHVRVVLSTTSVFAGATGPSLKVAVT